MYPFDPLGTLPENLIPNEVHTITAANGVSLNYVIPDVSPFYADSLVVIDKESGTVLTEGNEIFMAYPYETATDNTNKRVVGGFGFMDPTTSGSYVLVYRTLGGELADVVPQIVKQGLDTLTALTTTDWDAIADVPATFPHTPHNVPFTSIDGVPRILEAMAGMAVALENPSRNISMSDIQDLNDSLVFPIVSSMRTLAESVVQATESSRQIYFQANTGSASKDLGNIGENTWVPTGVVIKPGVSGTYMVNMAGNPTILDVDGTKLRGIFRYVIDGLPVTTSPIYGSVVGVSTNQIIGLEVQSSDGVPVTCVIAGPGIACGLSIMKVG